MPKYGFQYYKNSYYVPKHITVNLGGQTAAKAGAALSSRMVMDIVDEKGNKTRGFFTENETINTVKLFRSRAGQKEPPQNYEPLAVLPELIAEKCASNADGLKFLAKKVVNLFRNPSDAKVQLPSDWESGLATKCDAVRTMLVNDFNVPEAMLEGYGKDEKVNAYVNGIIASAFDAISLVHTHTSHQLQSENTNINRRNNAMSDYAQLLGMDSLVARSTSMTVVQNSKTIHGSFMMNAKGISFDELEKGTNFTGMRTLTITPEGYRAISNLQVLDFLCANIDRHLANMFYTVDDSDPAFLRITGVQGIDNDASFGDINRRVFFGGRVYDSMSLLADIKVMDKGTADMIQSLSFEQIEEKIRLAGLSEKEITAAFDRFDELKTRIEKGKIEIIDGENGWKKLAQNQRRIDNLKTYSVNMAYANIKNAKNVRNNYSCNIFGNLSLFQDSYNANYKIAAKNQNFSAVKGSVPVGTVKNILDNYGLEDHIAGLEHIRDEYAELSGRNGKVEAFRPVAGQLDAVIGLMKKYADKDRLTDNERNLLSEKLKELGESAGEYAQRSDLPDYEDNEYHAAKNIMAYTAFARESIRNDAQEAEMNLASRGADDIRRTHGIAPTAVTYEDLLSRVKSIAGRSTDFYKNMMRSFNKLGALEKNATDKEKRSLYNELLRTSAAYLKHKIPQGTTNGLNEKEKGRVRFAQDLSEYAAAHRQVIYEKNAIKDAKRQEKEDYGTISAFHARCCALVEKYKNAADSQNGVTAAKDVLAAVKATRFDLMTLMDISEKYDPDHDMQAACGKMLSGGIAEYMNVCLECYNSVYAKKETSIYKVLGMDESAAGRVKNIVARGREVEAGYQKAAATEQQPEQGTEQPTGMKEKEPKLLQ